MLEKTIFLFLILLNLAIQAKFAPTEQFPNSRNLSASSTLYWKHDDTEITFEIHYRDAFSVLFGIKSNIFSDVIFAWVNEEQIGHFSDRRLVVNQILTLDTKTDWIPLDAYFRNGTTVLKFKRNIKINCQGAVPNEDLDINPGTMNIVFKFGDKSNLNVNLIDKLSEIQIALLVDTKGPFQCPLVAAKPVLNSPPTGVYANELELIEGLYKVYWNFTDSDVTVEIHCKTDGWVAFGFSPNGGMDNSDVVVGWISNGKVNFTDRHISGRQVLVDKSQDVNLLYSAETNGINIFKFTRKIKSCDTDDMIIDQGSPYIIYAFGVKDPVEGGDINYHGMNRGGKVVSFISSSGESDTFVADDHEMIDNVISNVILPKEDTFYYCEIFQVPKEFTQKRHIYKWELILPDMNAEKMHHALIYECRQDYNGTPSFSPGNCYKSEIKMSFCQSITFGWAYGGRNLEIYPKDMGYPIGGDTDFRYYIFEIHYDNPDLTLGYIDKLTWRYHLTRQLREKELGVFTVGTDSTGFGIAIPPGVDNFQIKAFCPNDCLKESLQDNVTIIAAIPHTHLKGIQVWTKIVRKGIDIGYLFYNKYYDFNYQTSYALKPYINLTSDDELITQCAYRTLDRTEFVFGGPSTRDEMCLHFFTYFPRRPSVKSCFSVPNIEDYGALLYDLNKTGNAVVPGMGNSSESFFAALAKSFDNIKTNDYVRKSFANFFNRTRIYGICNNQFLGPYSQTKSLNAYDELSTCTAPTPETNINSMNFIISILRQLFNAFWIWLQSLF